MGTRRRRVVHTRPCCLPIGLGSPRSARPAMMNKPLRRPEPVVETGRDQKSPVRRCFKPRPPLRTGCAGFASGCRSSVRSSNNPATLRSSRSRSGRLSGLLSGCPPTDTRPQARAKLGKAQLSDPIRLRKFFAHRNSAPFNEKCTNKVGQDINAALQRAAGANSVLANRKSLSFRGRIFCRRTGSRFAGKCSSRAR